MSNPEFVIRFANNADTMVAVKTLNAAGLKPRLIARPHDVANESDLCLAVETAFEADAKAAFDRTHMHFVAI